MATAAADARVLLLHPSTANALTASLCVLTWHDFCSRPQELQGRWTKANFENVILAGCSFCRCRAHACVDSVGFGLRLYVRLAACCHTASPNLLYVRLLFSTLFLLTCVS